MATDLGASSPDDDVQQRDDRKRDRDRDGVRCRLGPRAETGEPGLDEVREGGLADPAERKARESNAQLTCRKVRVEAGEDLLGGTGVSISLRGELANPRLAYLDDRKLGRDKEPVQENEGQTRGAARRYEGAFAPTEVGTVRGFPSR